MQRKEVKAVLFDMDGVLVDSIDAWFHIVNDTLRHFGCKLYNYKEFKKNFGTAIEKDAKTIYHGRNPKEIAKFYNKRFRIRINKVKLFKDTIPTLKNLKSEKIKLALITNSTKFITYSILNHFKIKKYFDVIVTIEDVKHGKPAPDLILYACKKLQIKPQDAILVGDTINDILAGKRAKCTTVGYKIKGDYTVKRITEVLKLTFD